MSMSMSMSSQARQLSRKPKVLFKVKVHHIVIWARIHCICHFPPSKKHVYASITMIALDNIYTTVFGDYPRKR